MSIWSVAAGAVAGCLIPCADMCLRGTPERRLVGLEVASVFVTIDLVLLTMAFGRMPLMDLPLALALMSFGGDLVFVRFLGKHL